MEAKRKYVVQATSAEMKEKNPYNQFQLVALNDGKLESVICYGFKEANLQVIADKRNADHESTYETVVRKEREVSQPITEQVEAQVGET